MDGHYAWEKLHNAVLLLAAGSGSLRDRLEDTYSSGLMRLRPEHHFPWPDLRQRFEDLMQDMAPGGQFKAALASWPDEDLRRIAEGIVGLYDYITRRMGE